MPAAIEGVLLFGVLIGAILLSLTFAVIKKRQAATSKRILVQTFGLSIILYGIACLWWMSFAADGFSQVAGVSIYSIGFVLQSAALVLYSYRSNNRQTV
mgnify:CR=1 FL=1